LDAVPGRSEHSHPLTDTLGDVEPGFDRVINREALRPLLRALPERERQILYLRFFCEMTQNRIGEQFDISQMHVSRLLTQTCARPRDQVRAVRDPTVTRSARTGWHRRGTCHPGGGHAALPGAAGHRHHDPIVRSGPSPLWASAEVWHGASARRRRL
jgi:hypothetical protein